MSVRQTVGRLSSLTFSTDITEIALTRFYFFLWVILGLLLKLGPFQEISPWVSKGVLLITRPVCVKAQNKARGPVDSWRTIEDRKSIEKQILQKTPTVKYIQFELIIQVWYLQIDQGFKKLQNSVKSKNWVIFVRNWGFSRAISCWKIYFLYGKIKVWVEWGCLDSYGAFDSFYTVWSRVWLILLVESYCNISHYLTS